MRVSIMHVGHPGNVDIDWTVTRYRTFEEVLSKVPADAPAVRALRARPTCALVFYVFDLDDREAVAGWPRTREPHRGRGCTSALPVGARRVAPPLTPEEP